MHAHVDPRKFVHLSTPNRSLGAAGRRWVLVAIATTSLGVGAFATALGAWPVMPFAGIEVAFLALAFRVLAAHDADYERLEIGEHEVRWEVREARRVERFVAHRPWARVEVASRGDRCTVSLSYAGRVVALGRLMSDEGRRELVHTLRGRIPVTGN